MVEFEKNKRNTTLLSIVVPEIKVYHWGRWGNKKNKSTMRNKLNNYKNKCLFEDKNAVRAAYPT